MPVMSLIAPPVAAPPARTSARLTPSERRIARLAVAGLTNVEIGAELWVTLKTVETHLTNIYAKLGISGPGARTRLSAALEARTRR